MFDARVEGAGPSKVSATVISETLVPRPTPRLSVAQGVAKGRKVDLVVEKLVELGVDEIVVFHSGRSVPIWDDDRRKGAAERYRALARAAAKQSRRAWLPDIRGPVDRDELVRLCGQAGRCFVASPSARSSFREALGSRRDNELMVIVGPEGGLADAEIEDLAGAGAVPIKLGPQILRSETAALVVAAIALSELGRLE